MLRVYVGALVSTVLHFTESKGKGVPPLILIHGAGGTRLHWPPELRRLPDRRVLAVDLPGHGQSEGPSCPTVADFAAALVSLLDALSIRQVIIGGHSMGGAIAQTFALDYPDRAAGLILVGTGARLRVAPQILDGVKADFAGTVDTIIQWSFSPTAPKTLTRPARQRLLEVKPEVLLSDYAACNAFDAMTRVNQITCPTLVLVGSDDKMTPEKYSRYLVEQIAGAQMRVFPGAGHMLPLERAAEMTPAVQAFANSVNG